MTETSASHQRMVWVGGDGPYHIAVLEQQTLYMVDDVDKKARNHCMQALGSGAPVAEALGAKMKTIHVRDMRRIETADHLDTVKIRYMDGAQEKKETVATEGDEDRMAVFESLAAAIGDDGRRITQPLPLPHAIIGPSVATLASLGGTVLFYMAAADIEPGVEYEPTGRRRGLKVLAHWVLEKLGPTGVLVVGALCVAGSLFWLYRRITSPPTQFIVERTPTPLVGVG